MLISCEKCSTTYVLDDALIPAQGTPVQCTRCGHVFTAKPGAGEAPSPIAAAPPPPDKNSTLMFGAVGAAGPVPKPPPPAANQTMVFGTSAAASQPPPSRTTSPSNQTMVFGTQAATQPPGPVPKVNPASQTMVFGQSPSRPAATAAFGTPAAQAPSAPPKQPLASQTMVFGTQQATQQPPPAAPPKKGSETMVFGKGAPVGPVPGPTFGTPAATQSRPTMAAVTPPANQTLVFGAGAAAAQEEPAPKNQTMMFGRPASAKPIPKVTVGSVEAAGYAANEGTSESTVRVDLENMMGDEAAPAEESIEARHDRTQRYAMTDEAAEPQPLLQPESVEERHNRTVLFAMNPMAERTHPDAAPLKAPADDSNATLMFGNSEPEPLVGSVVLDGNLTPPEAHAASPLPQSPQSTMPHLPQLESNDNFAPVQPEDLGPGHGEQGFAGAVDLPPEPSFTADSSLADSAAADDAAVAQLRDSRTRRLTAIVVVLLVAVVALAAALFWFTFGRALVNKDSAQLLQQTQEAVTSLRRDDEGSRVEAIATLRALLVKSPQAPEVHSALVLALALSCDDLKEEVTRATDTLKRTRDRLSTSKERGSLDERIQKVNARLSQLQATLIDRQAELHAAQDALDRAAGDHELTPEQRFVVVRSRALGAAVLGEGSAIALAEEARQKSVSPDNWADLALPEYVINGGSSFDDALKQLEEVQQRDSTFLRAYVLAARIKVKQNELEGAEEQLGRVLALQPRHEVAGQLHEWIASRQRQAD